MSRPRGGRAVIFGGGVGSGAAAAPPGVDRPGRGSGLPYFVAETRLGAAAATVADLPGQVADHVTSWSLGQWAVLGGDGDHGVAASASGQVDPGLTGAAPSGGIDQFTLAAGRLYLLVHNARLTTRPPVGPWNLAARRSHLRLVRAQRPTQAPANRIDNVASFVGRTQGEDAQQVPVNHTGYLLTGSGPETIAVHWRKPSGGTPWRLHWYRLLIVALVGLDVGDGNGRAGIGGPRVRPEVDAGRSAIAYYRAASRWPMRP